MKKLFLLVVSLFLLTGCNGGGGGGGGGGSSSGVISESGSGSESSYSAVDSEPGTPNPTYHNPEPSSLILLGIGLSGLVISKSKKKRK